MHNEVPSWASPRGLRRVGYALLALLAYVPLLLTHPGRVVADTKTYLYLDPGRLLVRAVSMWDPHIGLGTVTHQNIGYLFPMGPLYWLTHLLGVPAWIAQRLWLGTILLFAGLGMLYLLRTLKVRGPGVAVAAVVFMLSPYALDFSARLSVILLPWAGLPWLLALVIRALREDRGWMYPAWFAIAVQLVGGVNATALVFAGIVPIAWIVYAACIRDVAWKRALVVTAKIGALTLVTSLWWLAGLSVQGTYGLNVLKYTETLQVVTKTSLASEVLRGLGYWFFYGIDKLGHWTDASVTYTHNPLSILISFAVPVLALLAASCIRWRHRGFFVTLVVLGVAVAVGAYPFDDPSPMGGLFKSFAESSSFGLALRSTSRAVPLVVLGLSVLLGVGVNAVAQRWPGRAGARWPRGLAVTGPLLAGALVVLAIVNVPALWNGGYSTKALERDEALPSYWEQAIAAADRDSHQTRILEVPGADFAAYRWGQTIDPITPGLTDRPYVARELVPWGSPASADLMNAYDRRMQEGVLSPDAVAPVARLVSAATILFRADLQTDRFNLVRADEVWDVLTNPLAPGLSQPRGFGDSLGPPLQLSQVDETQLAEGADPQSPPPVSLFTVEDAPNIVRAQDATAPVVVSGDGEGVVDLAAIGLVVNSSPIFYSASDAADAAALRAKAGEAQSVLVVTDTNRKRARRWGSLSWNLGYTERADEQPLVHDENDAPLELFPDQKADAQTVVETPGVEVAATKYGQDNVYEPQYRPARGIDGDVHTAWRVGEYTKVVGQRWQVRVDDGVTTDHVNIVQPLGAGNDRYLTKVELTFDGKDATTVDLGPESRTEAGQTIPFPSRSFHTLGVTIVDTNVGDDATPPYQNGVGLAEVRLQSTTAGAPVVAHEVTRMPTDLVTTAAKQAASRRLVFSMARLRSNLVPPYTTRIEDSLVRQFQVPNARTFGIGGTARLAPDAPDALLDGILGIPGVAAGAITVTTSGHMAGSVAARGSAATDGDPATAWTTPFGDATGQWVDVATATPVTVDHLDLRVVADGEHSLPTQLRIDAGGESRTVAVPAIAPGATGTVVTVPVAFPAVTGSDLKVAITGVAPSTTTNYTTRQPQVLPVAIAELGIPGVQRAPMPAQMPGVCTDALVSVDGRAQSVRVTGSTVDAVAGDALSVAPCGAATAWSLSAGDHTLRTEAGPRTGFDVDTMVLASEGDGAAMPLGTNGTMPAVAAGAARDAPTVKVTHNGDTKVEVHVSGATPGTPFWLVLGQSDNAGWEASADGKDLGGSTLVNGYANAWKVTPTKASFTATMTWAPQRTVWIALALSAVGLLACLVLGLLGWRRRRAARRAAGASDAADDADPTLAFSSPMVAGGTRPRPIDAVVAIVVPGIVGAVLARPWVGLVCAVAAASVLWWPRLRPVLTIGAPVALMLCALYIVVQQHRYDYVSDLDWPERFRRINDVAWLAVLLLLTDVLVQWARRRGAGQIAVDPIDGSAAASPDRRPAGRS